MIWFAKDNNYTLSIDEETVWHTVNQRQPGKPMEGNFNIPKMLIVQEIAYEKSDNSKKGKKMEDFAAVIKAHERVPAAD